MIVYPDYAGIYCRQYAPLAIAECPGPVRAGDGRELRATMYSGREQRLAG